MDGKEAARPHGRLDTGSWNTLVRFTIRLGVVVAIVAWPAVRGYRSTSMAWALAAAACWAASVMCAGIGLWRRETFNHGSLNHWDEGIAFAALARLAHLAQA